ncbi:hypothetical protein PAHAL_2G163900 [Panicum hallii]|uniref:PB1-like domain-containing protein n=1 Tax=Panicum hallii TaxID=206008 RepID=A0A2T8KPC6_9POAL|nr:hypothetical protein PAHAL_2G163900 [Panicum hallii]
MDRDEICFFNLIDLIEEYGYTSIDYLYYKRRDSLVALQLDTDVMEMLEENESKKNVSLFVTRWRIATTAPTKSNKEPSISAANRAKEKSGTKKKQQLNVIQSKQQYANEVDHQHDDDDIQETPVKCNQLGQPIGKEGGLLGQFLGTIPGNGGYCPIHIKDWRKVKNDNAETILQCIQTKLLYPRSCEKWILKSIGRDWRKYKATLEMQALSEKNKVSRGMKKTSHTTGTKSYARWSEDLGSPVELENLIEKQPELAQNSEGRVAWEGDALHQVLGEEKPGQVHGPKQSSDVETHMLEEIKQLKDRSRRQDKVIDELIIEKMHHESEEPTKNHVASSNRKRVRCAEPNHVDIVCQQRDELRYLSHLKSGSYPNKAVVAYATILSSSPKANVGGVERENQFYKVEMING